MINLVHSFSICQIHVLCSIFVWIIMAQKQCPPQNSTNNPWFQEEPRKVISNFNGMYTSIQCCIDGYTELLWYFRKLNVNASHIKQIGVKLTDNNRTLIILKPTTYIDTGFYCCTAKDDNGRNVSRSIFVYFLNIDETWNIQQQASRVAPETRFLPGANVSLSCSAFTYEPQQPISVSWYYEQNNNINSISDLHSVKTVVTTAFNRSGETNPDLVDIVSYLNIPNIRISDQGNYSCQMTQNGTRIEEIFMVSVVDDRINWILLAKLIAATVTVFIIGLLVWIYHYDIIVLYKSFLDPCPRGHSRVIDVSILYEDMDTDCIRVSCDLVRNLEKYGFHCWLYDRDKEFGGDMMDDYVRCVKQSHVLLIIFSFNSIKLASSLSSIAPDPTVRRLYVFIPNKTCIYNEFKKIDDGLMIWMNQDLKLQTFFQKNHISLDNIKSDKTVNQQLSTWVISSIPSLAIRKARQRISNKKNDVDPIIIP